MSKSRHTPIAGKLTRSFGIVDDEDLVVELRDDGTVALREEPTTRRLRRGEHLPEVVLDVRAVWDSRAEPEAATSDLESRIDRVIARLPIADLTGPPEKVGYQAKVWLMNALKKEFEND